MNNIYRTFAIPCIECGNMLQFRTEDEVIVQTEGRIVANIPCIVCEDCVDLLLNQVADPPGLICFNGLSANMAREILHSFEFILPRSDASKFFSLLFPEGIMCDSI